MPKDINLVPEKVKKEQAKKRLVKKSTLIAILILVLVALGTGYLVLRKYMVKNRIQETEVRIESLRSDIRSMQEIEVKARKLDKQYSTIRSILTGRDRHSVLLNELEARLPSSVEIETFTTGKENTINLSGKGSDYLAVAEFVNNLSNNNFTDGQEGLQELFTNVSLNSVNLDTQSSKARFFIVIKVNSELLKANI